MSRQKSVLFYLLHFLSLAGRAPQNAHSNAHTFPTMSLDVIAAPL